MPKTIKNAFWLTAGLLNFATFLIHLIGGQISLVRPLQESALNLQEKTEWLGAWHLISFFLLGSAVGLLLAGWNAQKEKWHFPVRLISWTYLAFSLIFIAVSLLNQTFAPQWILLAPVGIFGFWGSRRQAKRQIPAPS